MGILDYETSNNFQKVIQGLDDYKDPSSYYKTVSFAQNYNPFKSPYSMQKIGRLRESGFLSTEINQEKFKDPYGGQFKERLIDMDNNDYIASEAVNIRNWAAFHPENQYEVTLMPITNKKYDSETEITKDLNELYSEDERKEIIAFIESVNNFNGFRYRQLNLANQAFIGGRAALFIEKVTDANNEFEFPVGTPAILKPLSWSFLNQVRVETDSWALKSVRYTDFETDSQFGEPKFVPASDLLYVTRNDHNSNPNTLYYGKSEYHPILKLSESIRAAEESHIPEILTSMWSSGGLFEFKNMNTKQMDDFMGSVGPGLYRGINSENVKFTEFKLKHEGWFIMTLIENQITHMLMKLRTPEFLFNLSKATNRQAVEIQLNVFRDVVVEADRSWMNYHMNNQYYNTLLMLAPNIIGKITDPKKLKIKVVQRYKPLTFEDILAKANSIELLIRRFVIDRAEARQMLGLKPTNKVLDKYSNEVGQPKLENNPINRTGGAQNTSFGGGAPFGQPPAQRINSSPIGSVGAGAGNKT